MSSVRQIYFTDSELTLLTKKYDSLKLNDEKLNEFVKRYLFKALDQVPEIVSDVFVSEDLR